MIFGYGSPNRHFCLLTVLYSIPIIDQDLHKIRWNCPQLHQGCSSSVDRSEISARSSTDSRPDSMTPTPRIRVPSIQRSRCCRSVDRQSDALEPHPARNGEARGVNDWLSGWSRHSTLAILACIRKDGRPVIDFISPLSLAQSMIPFQLMRSPFFILPDISCHKSITMDIAENRPFDGSYQIVAQKY
ncbi:hypothetical protein ACRALDRAFT_207315 [Sodiomyces alcalophilus JCM 7366]|uniref:uncharacterized protein n=1 Tax=Sodiomyces alcalophilus JCM 7366 TaxID=591952 RepID=UPI0039B6C02E